MKYQSLRDFLEFLRARDQLADVAAPVSPDLEMTGIGTRLIAEGGPAVLFNNPVRDGAPYPAPWPRRVLANLFGTEDRVAWAMGRERAELTALGEALAFLNAPEPPQSLRQALDMLPTLKLALSKNPRTVSKPPCQQVVLRGDEIDLANIPIQTCWPGEPAPLITFPLVVTKAPDAKPEEANLGIYRMQVAGRNRTLMRWLQHRGGAQHAASHGDATKVPVAAVIGADPATTIAAVTPIPDKVSEYAFAGLLRGKRTELADCVTVPLKVPASAEMVIEGHVNLTETMDEGPYGDHTGYYNSIERFPVFTASAITMRDDAIYHTTYTGRPPDEPSVLAQALGDVFVPMLRRQFPEIVDFYLPPEACSYRIAVVSIRKAYAGHAKRVMMGIWSFLRQFLYTKYIIVVDDGIDVRDWKDVMWAVSTKMDPGRDITIVTDTPIDYLDFASPVPGLGGKAGLDATDKIGPETAREWGQPIRMADEITEMVSRRWAEYGLPDRKND